MPLGQQARQGMGGGRGGRHVSSTKPSHSFWKQGQWLAGVHVCFTIIDNVTVNISQLTCTLHDCQFSKRPGTFSAPSFLLHILISLQLFELCYPWNRPPMW